MARSSSAAQLKPSVFAVAGFGLLALCFLSGCFGRGRDPFTLGDADISAKDLNPVGEGYAWTGVKLGTYMDGHGLAANRVTWVIVRKRQGTKPELVWPVFAPGHDQANAAVLDGKAVFAAMLPDGQTVLMADSGEGPPLVISPAVLRLAARRLGTSVVAPGVDCAFSKVRFVPGRIWLQAGKPGGNFGSEKLFSLELSPEDLKQALKETRQRGKLITTKQAHYIAELASYSHLETGDVADAPKTPPSRPEAAALKPREGTAYRPQGEEPRGQALMDSGNHFAYFGTWHEPGCILKVNLAGRTNGGPAVVGALVLEPEEDKPFYCALDEPAGYGYFGTDYPGRVVKVALGTGGKPPSRIGSVLLDEENGIHAGVVDSGTGYACFNVGQRLCKLKLGQGDEPPWLCSSLTLTNARYFAEFVSAVLDPGTHCAYFGGEYTHVFKVSLGTDDSPPRIVGVLTLPDEEQGLRGALIDPQGGYAWFTSHSGYIVKIALGATGQPPTRIGSLKLDQRYQYLEYTFGMDREGYGYYGVMSAETILKVALGTKDELPRLVAVLPLPRSPNYVPSFRTGVVDPVHRTMCLGVGSIDSVLMTLTLGEGDSPPRIIGETKLYAK